MPLRGVDSSPTTTEESVLLPSSADLTDAQPEVEGIDGAISQEENTNRLEVQGVGRYLGNLGTREYHASENFSAPDVEQLQLTLRRFEVVSDIEQFEVDLGVKVEECIAIMCRLARLDAENQQIISRLNHLTSGAYHRPGLRYHIQFHCRMSEFVLGNASSFTGRRPFRRPLTSASRPFQRIGNAFYHMPSLTSSVFNCVYQAVHSGIHIPSPRA